MKSIAALDAVYSKQVLTYLRLMDKRLGLLINFGEHLIKRGIKRIVNGLPEESSVVLNQGREWHAKAQRR